MSSFYLNRRVLVTGGCSFIGSHLVESLVEQGAQVTVVDDCSSGLSENVDAVRERITFIKGDLRDSIVAHTATRGQEIVFHLANIHGGRGFIETHAGDICQNLLIDGNIFYQAHLNGIERICYISSACAYPTNLQVADHSQQIRYLSEEMADPFQQNRALADGEYGWGKLIGEMALKAYNKQFGSKGVSCRLFTVYGPRENESHAIIAFISKARLKQDPFEIWGSGRQDRNFTYVSDVVQGILIAAEKIIDCRAVNIGTDEITSVLDAAQTVCEIIGHHPKTFFFDTSKPEGVHARGASTENQKKWLHWQPTVQFKEGIVHTIEWHQMNRSIDWLQNNFGRKLFER